MDPNQTPAPHELPVDPLSEALAELAVGGRTREAMEADLKGMIVIEVTADDAWRGRQRAARHHARKARPPLQFCPAAASLAGPLCM